MAKNVDRTEEQIDLLRSIPLDEQPEKLDALWRQLMVFKTFAEGDLSETRSRRAEAEAARERAEEETVESTRRLYENLKSEAARKLDEVERLKEEATRAIDQAEAEKVSAREAKKDARKAAESLLAEANQQAREILDRARSDAQMEGVELRRQALLEIKTILSRIETVRTATDEELETQRIYTNVARIRSQSTSLADTGLQSNGDRKELVPAGSGEQIPHQPVAEQGSEAVADEPSVPSDKSNPADEAPGKPNTVARVDGKSKSGKTSGKR